VSTPRVTIVTPSYNQGAYLEETIRSVLDQDYPDLEYIVVDDGSTDGSVDIVRRYEDRLAFWTQQENAGQVAALNRGFARATGDVLGWINSDDTLLPGAVSTVVEALDRDPEALLVYGDAVFVDEQSRPLGPLPAREFDLATMLLAYQNHVVQPGSLFRRRALELAGPLSEDGYYFFDFEFVLRVGMVGRVVRIPEQLATYRVHPASKSVSAPVAKAVDQVRTYERLFARPDLPPRVRQLERPALSRAYLIAGEYFYAGLDQRRARQHVLHGLRLRPENLRLHELGLLGKTLLPPRLVTRLRALRRQG
jgi:glycosyltransferase involved in cell wall biosynthesis